MKHLTKTEQALLKAVEDAIATGSGGEYANRLRWLADGWANIDKLEADGCKSGADKLRRMAYAYAMTFQIDEDADSRTAWPIITVKRLARKAYNEMTGGKR